MDFASCPDCNGRGYFHCPCWPGDCICGCDVDDCERCEATGLIDRDEEAYYEVMADVHPMASAQAVETVDDG